MDKQTLKPYRTSRLQGSFIAWLFVVTATAFLLSMPLLAQQGAVDPLPNSPIPQDQSRPSSPTLSSESQATGSISGTVVDASGAAIEFATIKLTWSSGGDPTPHPDTKTDNDGVFAFPGVGAGSFQLAIAAAGFAPKIVTGSLSAGQVYTVPQIALTAAASIDVEVGLSQTEVAQIQLSAEEKQRVLGAIPNFYVSYLPNAVPLTPKQKFTLAGRLLLDPVSFGITGVIAGIQQASNSYSGYGQGATGYGKRYAASTGTFLDGVIIGNAILPSLFKQDPRYFYKGTGSVRSRILYAIAMSVMCKGDNGRWQVNYSGILGGLAAGGIANAYYPAKDRDGLQLTFINGAIGTAGAAAGNIVQEFVVRKLTPRAPKVKP